MAIELNLRIIFLGNINEIKKTMESITEIPKVTEKRMILLDISWESMLFMKKKGTKIESRNSIKLRSNRTFIEFSKRLLYL